MGLTSLLDLELAVPAPDELQAFWEGHGMRVTGPGMLGSLDRPSLLRLREGAYRHVAEMRVACETESDLDAIGRRLERLGLAPVRGDGVLRCPDPILDHTVVVQIGAAAALTPPGPRSLNRPGRPERLNRRSTACLGQAPHAPRRLGHVVFGTPDVAASRAFYVEGLGFKVSDSIGDMAYFLRCSPDHHNVLLMPSAVPCLNHYALEMDDIDAIGLAGAKVLAQRPDCSITGIGRHVVGANLFWYMLDPTGGMFELYADMDQIVDDEKWAAEHFRDDWDPFKISSWNSSAVRADFFAPADIDAIAKARAAAGR